MIKSLSVKNFAAFEELDITFSPKINIIIGENSSGKTQLLKAAYALTEVMAKIGRDEISKKSDIQIELVRKLMRVFRPINQKIGGLCNTSEPASLVLTNGSDHKFGLTISSPRSASVSVLGDHRTPAGSSSIFVPTKEVLSLLPAIAKQLVNEANLHALFDDTVLDLCFRLLKQSPSDIQQMINDDVRLSGIFPALTNAIGGQYEINGEEQHFKFGAYEVIERSKELERLNALKFMPSSRPFVSTGMTAEGFRKIGILQQLLKNGELALDGDSSLFWDEPESNMNPKLIKFLVQSLLEISRNGKQIFLATHDYVLLKWFDILCNSGKDDSVIYHSLSRNEEGKIVVQSASNYKELSINAIADTYSDLYDADIERALGGSI